MAPPFLTLALDGVEWSDSHSGSFIPREIATSTHGGSQNRSGQLGEEKNLFPLSGIYPGLSSHNPSLYQLSYSGQLK